MPKGRFLRFLSELEALEPGAFAPKENLVGFLVFTEAGKYSYGLDPDSGNEKESALAQEAARNNTSAPDRIQWFA